MDNNSNTPSRAKKRRVIKKSWKREVAKSDRYVRFVIYNNFRNFII